MSHSPINCKVARLCTLFSLSSDFARDGSLSGGYRFDIGNGAGHQWFRGTRRQGNPYESRHRTVDFDDDRIGWGVHILAGEDRALLRGSGNDGF